MTYGVESFKMNSTATGKATKMDYTVYRVTLDIAVPDYGGTPQLGGRDFIDVHPDAQELGFTETPLELFEVVEAKLNANDE